jgi:hypothetical protein
MAKQKKKRNKAYTGAGAASTKPTIVRIDAVNRGRVGQWWYDHKRIAKPAGIAGGIVVVVIILITEIIRLITG